MRHRAVPIADVITPNRFELEYLSGRTTPTLADALDAIDVVHSLGPRVILVTSLDARTTPADAIDLVASGPDGKFRLRTPRLPISASGTGDTIAALFFLHYLRAGSVADALSRAASSLFGLLVRTMEAKSREILLIEAQEELVAPSRVFEAMRI